MNFHGSQVVRSRLMSWNFDKHTRMQNKSKNIDVQFERNITMGTEQTQQKALVDMLSQQEMTAAEIGLLAIELYAGEESRNLSVKCML